MPDWLSDNWGWVAGGVFVTAIVVACWHDAVTPPGPHETTSHRVIEAGVALACIQRPQ